MLKRVYIFLMLMLSLVLLFTAAASASEINYLNLGIKSLQGQEMICLRELGEIFDWKFSFKNPEKHVYISNGINKVVLKINKDRLNSYKLSVPPLIYNGRTQISASTANLLLQELKGDEQMLKLIAHLSVDNKECRRGEKVKANIELINVSKQDVTLKYASGRVYDLYLLKDGEEVWRWSKDKFFTMALIKKELAGGEKLKYNVKIPTTELKPGKYILTGRITTEDPLNLNKIKIEIK